MKQIRIGDVVGDYKVIDVAGSGGMGEVYKIEHVITKRIEAMKLLPPASSSDPEQVQRFEREIQVQARLHHPNIVALYNAVREGNTIGLVMEFVEGESLQTKLESGPLPVATAVDYACQVLRALAYAHEAAVIHRDVAPANMIITPERVVKLMDFGLARGAADLRLSTTGVPVGSPWYMSPEQVKAIGPMDARTDIYATGAVLHEMLTGTKLFDVEGAFAVMRAHVEMVPAPPSSRNPAVPVALDVIVAKAVEKDPALRFQSADEFRLALQDAIAPPRRAVVPQNSVRAVTARMMPLAWPSRFRPSRAAVALALAPVALVAGYLRLVPAAKPVHAPVSRTQPAPVVRPDVPPDPVPTPVPPVAEVAPPPPPVQPAPAEAPANRTTYPVRAARKSTPPQNQAIRVTGGEPVPMAAAAAPTLPAARVPVPADSPESPAVESTKPPEAASAVAQSEPAPPTTDEAAPAKPSSVGSRLVRAIGKVNPFHKTPRQNNDTSSKTPLKKD